MLKVGRKKLFLLDGAGKPHELSPMCVLDFYVTETRQRTGCGKRLFEAMLRREQVEPRSLAVDRPSEKLISFLRKHYSLASIIPQVLAPVERFDKVANLCNFSAGQQLCHLFWLLQRPAAISAGCAAEEAKNLHGQATICLEQYNK